MQKIKTKKQISYTFFPIFFLYKYFFFKIEIYYKVSHHFFSYNFLGEKNMKIFSRYGLIFAILFSTCLFADDEKRIEPGTRKFSEKELKELDHFKKQESATINKKQIPAILDNQYPPLLFNYGLHNISGISALGDYLVIEDGSEWNIKPGYADEAFSWRENDPILIVINDSLMSSFFYGYKYKMINTRTNSFVEVKLHLGPILNNPSTLQIAEIIEANHQIILSDNSVWHCDPSQYYIFNKFLPGDGIIIGTNVKSWFNSSYDALLINVNLLQEIRSDINE
jgi:hypothetical protein